MKQNSTNTTNPQIIRATKTLQDLAPMVSTDDKKCAPFSKRTVEYYLGGSVKDIDTAVSLIKFFRKRIKEREALFTPTD